MRRTLTALGICLLTVWLMWWCDGVRHNRLRGATYTWLPFTRVIGIDFYTNYFSARAWVQGKNPYIDQQIPNDHPYGMTVSGYPPQCFWQFVWCRVCSLRDAKTLWLVVSVVILVAATITCLRVRRDLKLWRPAWPFALAGVLFCSPVVFELERGQCNVLILLHLLLIVVFLRRKDWGGDVGVGILAALAFWTKLYPLMFIAGLLPLQRWRAFGCAGVSVVLMGLVDLPGLAAAQQKAIELAPPHSPLVTGHYHPFQHALGAWWTFLWQGTAWKCVGQVPELLSASLMLLPVIGLCSWAVFRLPVEARERLTLPYFLWLTGVFTFASPIANDYSLIFLPLAVLAVSDRRDPSAATLLLGASLVWLQPLFIPVSPLTFVAFKLALVGGSMLSLLTRCKELSSNTQARSASEGQSIPAFALPARKSA